jgi:hypothetical protein
VYGERHIALAMISVPKHAIVRAVANTAFGTHTAVMWTEDDPIPEKHEERGLVVTQILNTELPKTGEEKPWRWVVHGRVNHSIVGRLRCRYELRRGVWPFTDKVKTQILSEQILGGLGRRS